MKFNYYLGWIVLAGLLVLIGARIGESTAENVAHREAMKLRIELEQYKEGEMQQTERVKFLESETQRLRTELSTLNDHLILCRQKTGYGEDEDVLVPLLLDECADRIEEAMWLLEGSECCICVHDPDEWERRYKVWKDGLVK